ncbi:MAG: hypothetical protein H5T84_00350, partial [Thermoleophilia bacterium]|nr:hypothetical protein [Thermoleophilia bacterium]
RLLDVPPTSIAAVEKALRIGREEGLRYVYGGNVPGHASESTFCPSCGEPVICRRGFQVEKASLRAERCARCGEVIAGVMSLADRR